jgi:hypothetical protein
MDLRNIGWNGTNWIHLAKDRDNIHAADWSTIQFEFPPWDCGFPFGWGGCTFNRPLSCSSVKVKGRRDWECVCKNRVLSGILGS